MSKIITLHRKDDKGVQRQYYDAKPNPMFDAITTTCVKFVRYKENVPCALCGKLRKLHWTCIVRFKAANLDDHHFAVKLSKQWFPAGTPICDDHPTQPDRKEFLRKVKQAQKNQRKDREIL